MLKILYIFYFFIFNFITQDTIRNYESDSNNSSWKVEYSENCYIPFSDVELTMLEEVYGDNLNKYVLDKKNSKNHTNIFFVDNQNNQNNGWQGRLCWDVPIVCTNIKIQVNRKNDYLIINKLVEN